MKQELSPLSIILILGYFGLLGVLGFWSNSQEAGITGPASIKQSAGGDVLVQIGNTLYRTTSAGDDIGSYDLSSLGVGRLFDYVLISDNQVIVRLGDYSKNVLENISDFLRLPNTQELKTPVERSGLYQCDLERSQCDLYSSNYDPDDVHWFAYDEKTKELFVSDVTRHQIHRLDAHGEKTDTEGDEFIFPNSMLIDNEKLYVVDTNHRKIKQVHRNDASFGRLIKQFDPVSGESEKSGHRYPYMLISAGQEFWVLNMNNAMRNGGVYRFNKDWSYVGAVPVSPSADIGHMAVVDNEVWLSDYQGDRILRYDWQGSLLGEFTSASITDRLQKNKEQRHKYSTMTQITIGLFVVSIGVGIAVGLWQMWSSSPFRKSSPISEVKVNINDPGIVWLKKNESVKRKSYLIVIAIALMLLSTAVLSVGFIVGTTKEAAILPLFLPVAILTTVMIIMFRMFYMSGIGVRDDVLILKRGKKYRAARGDGIYYSGSHIAIKDIIMPLQVGTTQYYQIDDIIQHLNPIIQNAKTLTSHEMNLYQLKITPKWAWIVGGLLLLLLITIKF